MDPNAFLMASGNHQMPSDQVQKGLPSAQGKTFSSVMDPELKEIGMWHIWYYIPLCTIFPQKSNGDIFSTQLCNFKMKSPSPPLNFEGKLQSFSLAIHGGYQKTTQGHQSPVPSGFGYFISTVFLQWNAGPAFFMGNFKGLLTIKSVVKE
ncbi:hypothetical protein O181_021622 [Austropuccinia psidii MF-1]|uniref:Uncharacterized protein n=1 Tax=Austropuccinia psidii MF-1 TaxID=1389203 RepID=A0A9Q3CFV5_9BASI|nr:hypothetical protein [Austropuccinia psidii MF-1]